MSLRIGDDAPNFKANTSQGEIDFYEYLGDSWGVLFSHPADYTPVCTTELGRTAALKDEFEKRNVKVIALSTDNVESHKGWINDINETQDVEVTFPIIGDENREISQAYDMIHPNASLLRVIDSLQLTAYNSVATPADWKDGEDVVVLPSIKTEDIPAKFPKGFTEVKPYLRLTPQPNK
jgi:alkyl hydroperoxide reductase subunit AhpC